MNHAQAIMQTLREFPGLTAREVFHALPAEIGGSLSKIGSQLTAMCESGHLRREKPLGLHAYRYHVTGKPLRQSPTQRAAGKNAARTRRRAAKRLSDDQKRANYTSAKANPPKPASSIRIVDPPRPKATANPASTTETVAEFQARGGIVQTLEPHACSAANTLRFDHSNTRIPTGKRRPNVRARPHAIHP